MRGDLPKREPSILEFWKKLDVYAALLKRNEGGSRGPFALHDGPPYANGHIHIGHALNKILKDFVVKSKALLGYFTPYRPGWDCHGLPIETELLKELKMERRHIRDVADFRGKAKAFAERFIEIQKQEFVRLGCVGDWGNPYTTMQPQYEGAILKAFRELALKGYIYRGLKPVHWCVHCETALAEAEVEYKTKRSPSIYVKFPVKSGSPFDLPPEIPTYVLIWTTTPWTLPANAGLAFHPELKYVHVEVDKEFWILAENRLEALRQISGADLKVATTAGGDRFKDLVCLSPLGFRDSKGVLGEHVKAGEGTGVVHTAPGHGEEDFHLGRKWGLPVVSPVDDRGVFTQEAGRFAGKGVFEANPEIISVLKEGGLLLAEGEIEHSYPHCWRCKKPVLFRATEQWFLNVGYQGLREKLLKAIEVVRWLPPQGRSRITGMVAERPDWCISRQRFWGTPIPVFYCKVCGKHVLEDPALAEKVLVHVERLVREKGADIWFSEPAEKLMPPGTKCPCGGGEFRKETDILDVWVDSGASWLAVMKEPPKGQPGIFPAQMYLEGSDQHRGWFQASLVPAVALSGRPPYEAVLTHGWVLDDQGRAMHKSLGNVVSPQKVVEKWGADLLRLWVALSDWTDDVRLSDKLMEGPADAYRKIRNTFRYLLGATSDFDPVKDSVPYDRLPEIERYVLHELARLQQNVEECYDRRYDYRHAATYLVDFCNLDLSSFYLDVRKDALYTLDRDDPVRRSAQTVMWECLQRLALLASPVLSFTCEEVWQTILKRWPESDWEKRGLAPGVFLQPLEDPKAEWSKAGDVAERWVNIRGIRGAVQKKIEELRAKKDLGSSLEAKVVLYEGLEDLKKAALPARDLSEAFIVSSVEVARDGKVSKDNPVHVEKAGGSKCARCWRYPGDVGGDRDYPGVCLRCARVLKSSKVPPAR